MQSSLGSLIRTHGGFFSRAEAIDCGETDRTLANARREGVIVRLRRGMYAPADIYEACDGQASICCMLALRYLLSEVPLHSPDDQRLPSTDLRSTRKISPLSISSALITARPVKQLEPSTMSSARTSRMTSARTTGLLPSVQRGRCGKSPVGQAWKVAWSPPIRRCGTSQDCLNRLKSCNTVSRTSLGRTKESWPSSWPMDVLSPLGNQ
jgi:Transcriptional regulator, AbiEi antitoxin